MECGSKACDCEASAQTGSIALNSSTGFYIFLHSARELAEVSAFAIDYLCVWFSVANPKSTHAIEENI
jgi:hypothetical protein